jgi:secretion/DNA translocation related TadE-like protein
VSTDRGSATVLTLALLCGLLFFSGFGLALGEVVVAQTRLGQLADEAARAGAYAVVTGADPCVVADGFVRHSVDQASATHVVRCEEGAAVTVTVAAPLPRFLQPFLSGSSLHATARAGS